VNGQSPKLSSPSCSASALPERWREYVQPLRPYTEFLIVPAQDKAEFLFSLVADLKDAMFVGELADDPQVMQTNRGMRLRYPFASGYDLELEPTWGGPPKMASGAKRTA
jgi:hypothetical protein